MTLRLPLALRLLLADSVVARYSPELSHSSGYSQGTKHRAAMLALDPKLLCHILGQRRCAQTFVLFRLLHTTSLAEGCSPCLPPPCPSLQEGEQACGFTLQPVAMGIAPPTEPILGFHSAFPAVQ